jgi:tetratricopeptide (TPR) repeat protein
VSDQSHKPIFHGPVYGVVIGEDNTVIINLPDGTQRIIPADASFFTTMATRPEHFVGRQRELNDLEAKLLSADSQTVAITALYGMGGVGKTALAVEIVYDLAERFPGGVLWADFASHQGDPLPILDSWAQLCGRPELVDLPSEEIRAQAVARAITAHIERFGRMLAIFDDVRDTKSDAWLKGAHLLRKAVPDGTPLLITTRQTSVASSLRAHYTLSLDVLDSEDAVELVTRLIPDIEPALASELAELTGNLPLAIEIAAALVKTEGLDWIIESLRDPETRIDTLGLNSADRKEDSIRLSFSLSYQSLSPELSELFRSLGAFVQGYISPEWVLGLFNSYPASAIPQDGRAITQGLRALASRSLLQRTERGYRFHPLLRDYALQLLVKSDEYDTVASAHMHWFLDLVTRANAASQAVGPALENVWQAADYAYKQERWSDVIQFTQNLAMVGKFLHTHGRWQDALDILHKGLEACRHLSNLDTQATFLCEIGTHQRESGQYNTAETTFQQAIELCRQIRNDYILANALFGAGYVQLYRPNYEEAVHLLEQTIEVAERSQNQYALGEAIRGMGRIKISQGEIDTALAYLQRSNPILQTTGNQQAFAYNLRALGEAYAVQGNYEEALRYFDQAMRVASTIGDLQAQAYILRGFGDAYRWQERYEDALDAYLQSEQLYRDTGDRAALAGAVCSAGDIYLLLNDPEAAHPYFEESIRLANEANVTRWQARSLFGLAQVEESRGNKQLACQLGTQALEKLEKAEHRDSAMVRTWLDNL